MSKFKKISGQATSLGVASWIALAGFSSTSFAQDAAPEKKAAVPAQETKPVTTPIAPKSATTGQPGQRTLGATDAHKTGPLGHPPGRDKGDKLEKHSDKDDKSEKASKGDKDSSDRGDKADKKKSGVKPVSRSEAIKHYREAQTALVAVPEPEDPKSEAAAEARKARRDAMRDLRRARDEILRSHNEQRREFQKRKPEDVEKLRKQVTDNTSKMRKDRKERSEKRREEIVKVVGDKPLHPAVREELRSHAWRIARLNQLVFLAEVDNKAKIGERAKELIEKENTAHDERLKALLAKAEIKNYKPKPQPAAAPVKASGPAQKLPAGHPPLPTSTPTTKQPSGAAQ